MMIEVVETLAELALLEGRVIYAGDCSVTFVNLIAPTRKLDYQILTYLPMNPIH